MRTNILLFPLAMLLSGVVGAVAMWFAPRKIADNPIAAVVLGMIVAMCAFFPIALLIQKVGRPRKS
jgi:hypothetical protein